MLVCNLFMAIYVNHAACCFIPSSLRLLLCYMFFIPLCVTYLPFHFFLTIFFMFTLLIHAVNHVKYVLFLWYVLSVCACFCPGYI